MQHINPYAVLNAVFIDMRTLGGVFMLLLMNMHCLLQHYMIWRLIHI